MDQNTPREDAAGAQPPADAGQAVPDQSQPAAGGGQEAAAEYAAWSADATYQQQQAQQQQAQQQADTQAYAAPEPQSATYSDPAAPAADQQYAQQPAAYDQQAYAQQQQAYAQQQQGQQQPAAYDQQAYAQPGQQQPAAYDQQAYAQQQQAYAQQQQQAQQQQPQYYDQNAYGQQPGYYDQSAYGQQQPAQQGYQQPYSYGQPQQGQQGQPAWPGDSQYWEEGKTGYGRSFIAVLAGFAMLTWGIAIAMGGGLVLWTNDLLGHLADLSLSAEMTEFVEKADDQVVATGGILLIIGIMFMIGAVGVLAHRKWGRAFGIVLGFLGTLLGIGIIFAAIGFELLDGIDVNTVIEGEEASLGAGIFVTATFLLIFLGMFIGRRHFRKKGVES